MTPHARLTMSVVTRAALAVAMLACASVVGLAATAGVAAARSVPIVSGTGASDRDTKTLVVLTGDIVVASGDRVDNVVLINGDLRINGRVTGDVFVVNGNVVVTDVVKGDVTSLNGRVTLLGDAQVGGDVVSKDPPRIAASAHVSGDIDRARNRFALGRLGTIGRVFLWIVGTVSSLLLGAFLLLVGPRAMESVADATRTAVGPMIGLGVAIAVSVPIVGVLLSITLLALPLGVALLFGLGLFYGVGYAAGAVAVGRLIVRRPTNRWLSFLAGWGILRVLAIVPVLGVLLMIATIVVGLGSITVAVHRSQRSVTGVGPSDPTDPQPAPQPPSPPTPVPAT